MLIVIIIFALILRLISFLSAGSFWFDETFTLYFARLPWAEAWQYLQFENSPPLHFFLAHIFVVVFGQNEFLLRLTSVAMSVGTIPMVYLLGKKVHSHIAGLIAAGFFAVSGLNIFNAVEFRPYPLLILLTALSIYFFIKYFDNHKRATLVLLVIINTLLLLTHLTAVMIVAIETFYILWRKRELFWRWCLWQSMSVAVFLVWWLPSFLNRAVEDVANSWFFSLPFDPLFLIKQMYAFLVFPVPDGFPTGLIVLVGIGFAALLVRAFGHFLYTNTQLKFKSSQLKYGVFFILLVALPVLIGFVLNVQIPKQYSISLAPFVVLLGAGVAELVANKKLKIIVLVAGILSITVLNYSAIWRKPYALDQLVKTIEKESGPKTEILAAAHIYTLPLELYYHGTVPVKPIYFGADSMDDKLRLVRHNWHINYYSKEDLNRFLTSETKNYTTMLVVGTTHWQNEGDIVRIWFMTNGWRLARTYSWDGYFNPDLHVFKKITK